MWHHFGDELSERSCDLVNMYKKYFMSKIHPDNLAKLVEQFNWRPMVNMKRDENVLQIGDSHTLKVAGSQNISLKLRRVNFYTPPSTRTFLRRSSNAPRPSSSASRGPTPSPSTCPCTRLRSCSRSATPFSKSIWTRRSLSRECPNSFQDSQKFRRRIDKFLKFMLMLLSILLS